MYVNLQLRAAEIMRKRVTEKENIEILYNTNTLGLFGEDGVEGAHLVRFKGEENEENSILTSMVSSWLLVILLTPTSSKVS